MHSFMLEARCDRCGRQWGYIEKRPAPRIRELAKWADKQAVELDTEKVGGKCGGCSEANGSARSSFVCRLGQGKAGGGVDKVVSFVCQVEPGR
jgi:hypothetical protein